MERVFRNQVTKRNKLNIIYLHTKLTNKLLLFLHRYDGFCYGHCQPFWFGDNCQEYVCPLGFFGDMCKNTCHCENDRGCDSLTGVCGGPCLEGWTGNDCQTSNVFLI